MQAPPNMNRGISGTTPGKPMVGVGNVALLSGTSGPQPSMMRINVPPIRQNVAQMGPYSPLYQQRELFFF